jgi:hypothetical protein
VVLSDSGYHLVDSNSLPTDLQGGIDGDADEELATLLAKAPGRRKKGSKGSKGGSGPKKGAKAIVPFMTGK